MGVTHNQEMAGMRRELEGLLDVARSGLDRMPPKGSDASWAERSSKGATALFAFARGWQAFADDIRVMARILVRDAASLETLYHRYDAQEDSCYSTDPRDCVAVAEMLLTWHYLTTRYAREGLSSRMESWYFLDQATSEMEELPGYSRREANALIEACHALFRAMGSADTYAACPLEYPCKGVWLDSSSWEE